MDLASETDYPVLQVKMASKVCTTLRVSIDIISEFLSDYDSSEFHQQHQHSPRTARSNTMIRDNYLNNQTSIIMTSMNSANHSLQEIELEMFSALANDQANHIEEVYALINKITGKRRSVLYFYDSSVSGLEQYCHCNFFVFV